MNDSKHALERRCALAENRLQRIRLTINRYSGEERSSEALIRDLREILDER